MKIETIDIEFHCRLCNQAAQSVSVRAVLEDEDTIETAMDSVIKEMEEYGGYDIDALSRKKQELKYEIGKLESTAQSLVQVIERLSTFLVAQGLRKPEDFEWEKESRFLEQALLGRGSLENGELVDDEDDQFMEF